MERYFYHSLPRGMAGTEIGRARGLAILGSICRNGLLLTPEAVSWSDPTQPDASNRLHAIQRRICFTELLPSEVREHGRTFGDFAIEFNIEALLDLGVLPVFYVPDRPSNAGIFGVVGTSLLSHLAAARTIIDTISKTKALSGPGLNVSVQMKATGEIIGYEFDSHQETAVKAYIELLEIAEGLKLTDIAGALSAMASLFYPTDNPRFTGTLGYYRQREWRLFSGGHANDVPVTTVVSAEQATELLSHDERFFSVELQFPDGTYTRAAKSHYWREFSGKHILCIANRVIVPAECVSNAEDLLQS